MYSRLIIAFLLICMASSAYAFTAHVEFTPPADSNFVTDVVVTDTDGDWSGAFGQRSDPGASSVDIGGIAQNTTYWFKARRLNPETWEPSGWSEIVSITSGEYAEPMLNDLPPTVIRLENVQIEITIR